MNDPEPVRQSLLGWTMAALGPMYMGLLLLSALASFVLVLVLLARGKGPLTAAAIVLIVHTPLMIGIFAAFQGMISAFSVVAMSETAPKPNELAAGFSTALFAPVVAMLLMVPSYLAAAIGGFFRAIFSSQDTSSDQDF